MGKWEDKLENTERCAGIAKIVEAGFCGEAFVCPSCGNIEISPKHICRCGDMEDVEEWEAIVPLENIEIYDIEYRIGADLEYRSVELMVAGGGPTIYIDTELGGVKLHWGTDEAFYPLTDEANTGIDEMFALNYEARFSIR